MRDCAALRTQAVELLQCEGCVAYRVLKLRLQPAWARVVERQHVRLMWLAGAGILALGSFVFGLAGFGLGLVALALLPFPLAVLHIATSLHQTSTPLSTCVLPATLSLSPML